MSPHTGQMLQVRKTSWKFRDLVSKIWYLFCRPTRRHTRVRFCAQLKKKNSLRRLLPTTLMAPTGRGGKGKSQLSATERSEVAQRQIQQDENDFQNEMNYQAALEANFALHNVPPIQLQSEVIPEEGQQQGSQPELAEDKIRWTPELVGVLGQCMARFIIISAGQSGAVTGRVIDWRKTVEEFKKQSGLNWGYKRLKSKHDNLKMNFRLWLKLKNNETGLGWNYHLDTIEAPDEWWNRKLKEDKRYMRFQRQGFSEELENWLHIVFGTSTARGHKAFSTSGFNSGPWGGSSPSGFSNSESYNFGDPASDTGNYPNQFPGVDDGTTRPSQNMNQQFDDLSLGMTPNQHNTNRWLGSPTNVQVNPSMRPWLSDGSSSLGKRASSSEDSNGFKKTRRGKQLDESASRFRSIDQHMSQSNKAKEDVIQLMRNVGSSFVSYESAREVFSIGNALARLHEVQDLDRRSPMYLFAYSLLYEEAKREAFLRCPTVDDAWRWVEFQYSVIFPAGFGPGFGSGVAGGKSVKMSNQSSIAARLLNDRKYYFEFVKTIGTYIVMDDDVIISGALLAATIAHNPPPRYRHHSGSYPGLSWIDDLLAAPTDTRIFNAFRMNKYTFIQLCDTLSGRYGLSPSEEVTVREKVGIFLHVLAKKQSNRDTQERFSRSGWAVSTYFHDVLNAMDGFGHDIVRPRDPTFAEVSPIITNNHMYLPFMNAVGALDGSHVKIIIDEGEQLACRGRKRETTTNILAICDFDMLFTFVVTGWEGSAHDAFVLNQAKLNFNFPKPPEGKYYLADKGYANRGCILTPYNSGRYHASQWRGHPPQGREETFNRWHSSLRSVIERAFGVLKMRWHILECVPHFKPMDQNRIIAACFAINNYIRLLDPLDELFDAAENDYVDVVQNANMPAEGMNPVHEDPQEQSMDPVREAIANEFTHLH